ncbi:MAG: M15 family metallopeptidase [Bacteroidales bacterium]|nr:M15 family metallopeptidase [Bacteroidales bacterium]
MKTYLSILAYFFIFQTILEVKAQNNSIGIADTSELERVFVMLDLVNVQQLDNRIAVDLKYSTKDNFVKKNMYGQLQRAYLNKDAAEMLARAQQILSDTLPGFRLLIYDATRPQSIQWMMWKAIKVPESEKSKYVSNPKYGSLHNFGAAVDLTIIDNKDQPLDMGTSFDSFEKLAYPYYEEEFLKKGKLSKNQYNNRLLLRYVMKRAGFMGITTEWWHFNACYRKDAKQRYNLVYSHLLTDYLKEATEKPLLVDDSEKPIFRVQIYTSGKAHDLKWKSLKGFADFRYYHKGLYKYTGGSFVTIEEANDFKNQMRKQGFKGSFIVPFYQGERIELKDAVELLQ